MNLGLRGRRPGPGHQLFVALGGQLVQLAPHVVEPTLELVDHLVLGAQAGRSVCRELHGGHLPLESNIGEVVELLRVGSVAGGPELVALPARGQSRMLPAYLLLA